MLFFRNFVLFLGSLVNGQCLKTIPSFVDKDKDLVGRGAEKEAG